MTVKGGEYVLLASVYRETGEDGVRRRRKRGDKITLTAEQAERLLAAGAVGKPSDDEAKAVEPGADLAVAPAVVTLEDADPNNVSTFAAIASNSGLGPADADDPATGVLSEEQVAEGNANTVPPKSATVAVWRKWAVDSGKLTEDEAADADKGDLQALAAK